MNTNNSIINYKTYVDDMNKIEDNITKKILQQKENVKYVNSLYSDCLEKYDNIIKNLLFNKINK